MSDTDLDTLLGLVSARRGHFLLESGLHAPMWLDLDTLFAHPARIAPFVRALASQLVVHRIHAVCGPLLGGAFLAQLLAHELKVEFCFSERITDADADAGASRPLFAAQYRLPPAFGSRLRGKRVAVVDDVMSAGSSLRATEAALRAAGAEPVVVGALLALGVVGADYFASQGIAVAALTRAPFQTWMPATCPLCASGQPLEQTGTPAPAP